MFFDAFGDETRIIPPGGASGQVLAKASGINHDMEWVTVSGSGGGGSVAWGSVTGTLADQIDLQSALAGKANSAHTHTATDITDGTMADGRISQSNVTQHQSALSITTSQISDLETATVAFTNKSGNISQWANDVGYITQQLSEQQVEDYVGGMLTGNNESLITVTYQSLSGTIDFAVDSNLANYDNTTSGFITSSDIPVNSVNGQTGVVSLNADNISDAATTNKFTTQAEIDKLAGIEANATADQTDAEIKTAYENNADTNAFTNAEKSKLSAIEDGATQDQTGAEIVALINTALGSSDWQSGLGGTTIEAVQIFCSGKAASTLNANQAINGTHKMPLTTPLTTPTWLTVLGDTITLVGSGSYEFSVDTYFTISAGARCTPCGRFAVGGSASGARANCGYIRAANAQMESSLHLSGQIFEVTTSETVEFWYGNSASVSGTNFTVPASLSSITVRKIS